MCIKTEHLANHDRKRVMQYQGGGIIGELDFYLQQRRSFLAEALGKTVVCTLSKEQLDEMYVAVGGTFAPRVCGWVRRRSGQNQLSRVWSDVASTCPPHSVRSPLRGSVPCAFLQRTHH